MITGNAMKHRLQILGERGIPVTNYGLFLAWANGLLPRAINMLPEFPLLWEEGRQIGEAGGRAGAAPCGVRKDEGLRVVPGASGKS